MSKVTALFGGPTGLPEVNPVAVETLEMWLEMARSGKVVGVALAGLCADGSSRYAVGGRVGGYGMIGALTVAKAEVLDIARDVG